MKNRKILLRALLCAVLLAPFSAAAQIAPQAGKDYIALDPPLPVRAPKGKIEVLEFFNFSCPHCFRLQGAIARWRRDGDLSDVALLHQPVVFRSHAGHYARMFHTLEAMGAAKDLYGKVFEAIHREKRLLNNRGRFADWLDENGLDGERGEQIYDSFSVGAKVARAERVADSYGVNSTPQIAVAGKYLLTPSLSGSMQRMMTILSALLAMERKNAAEREQRES